MRALFSWYRSSMADLRTHARMSEYIKHLRRFESSVPHFYCDSEGYVTVGIGQLVDIPNLPAQQAEASVRDLHGQASIFMLRRSDGRPATVDDMVQDWRAVRAEGLR